MATRAVKEKRISVDFEHGEILWRVYNAETEEWNMFAGPCLRMNGTIGDRTGGSGFEAGAGRRSPRNSQELAVDIAYMKTGIRDEEYDRPVCPRLLVVLDWKADMILRMDMMKPDDDGDRNGFGFLCDLCDDCRPGEKSPGEGTPGCLRLLSEICDYCGIELKKDRLGKVDRILEEMAGMMG